MGRGGEGAAVHGITQEQLTAEGEPARNVYRDLLRTIDGRHLVSDSPSHDGRWFRALVAAALDGSPQSDEGPPPLLDLVKVAWKLAIDCGRRPDIAWQKAELEAGLRFPQPHRAGPDARHNAALLRLIAGG